VKILINWFQGFGKWKGYHRFILTILLTRKPVKLFFRIPLRWKIISFKLICP